MKTILFIASFGIAALLTSCGHRQKAGPGETTKAIPSLALAIDNGASSCPYFTSDKQGNIFLSWARNLNDSLSVMCFAVSTNKGRTFGQPFEIPGSTNLHAHAENMPKMLVKPSGEVIAVWGASNPNPENEYCGRIFFSQSFDGGKSWNQPTPLVRDPAGFDQRYFDLALLPGGEAAIVWLDNRKSPGKEGSALYFAATNGTNGFEGEKRIGESCCECCRTDLFIDSKKNIHIAYRGIINDSIRDMVHIVSSDAGISFSDPRRLSKDNWVIRGCPHTGPAIAENKSGLYFAWYTMGTGTGLYFCSTTDNGNSFSGRDTIREKSSARHPQIESFGDGQMLLAWDETSQTANGLVTSIGIQKRSAEGRRIFTQYITPDTVRATYPVLYPIDGNTALIAYDQETNKTNHVVYSRLTF